MEEKEQGGVLPMNLRLAQPGCGSLGGKIKILQSLLSSDNIENVFWKGSLSTALVLKVPPENARVIWQTLVDVMLCHIWRVQVKENLFSALEELLVLKGASNTHRTSPDSAHPLSTDTWAERESFPGEVFKVGGEDGLEPQWSTQTRQKE